MSLEDVAGAFLKSNCFISPRSPVQDAGLLGALLRVVRDEALEEAAHLGYKETCSMCEDVADKIRALKQREGEG